MTMKEKSCKFCGIAEGSIASDIVFEDGISAAFLDSRPLFPGHCLLVPKEHYETLADLPNDLITPFFANAQLIAKAMEQAMEAEGSFVAINNKVSQSIPHLHVHIVPRSKGDGLKGFFWPRHPYKDENEIEDTRNKIIKAINSLSPY